MPLIYLIVSWIQSATNQCDANIDDWRVRSFPIRGYITIQPPQANKWGSLQPNAYVINPSVTSCPGRHYSLDQKLLHSILAGYG